MLILGIGLLLLVVIIAFARLNKNTSDQSGSKINTTVRYAVPLTIAAAPAYVAEEKGFWKDAGVDVKVTYFDSGREALDALLSNNAEFMSVSETPPLRAYMSGQDIKIFTTTTEHREAKLTVRTDRVTQPNDVKGKKIGTVAGTNSDYYMYRWLEDQGIGSNEVEIIQLDPPALSQAFVQGNIDVMFAWEPHNFNAYSKIAEKSKSWPTELYSGRHTVVMNSSYLNSNTAVAERIIKGFLLAEDFIKNNPEESKRIVREATGISSEALNNLWGEYTYKIQLDNEFKTILTDEADWIKKTGNNSTNVNAANIVDSRALRSAEPRRVGGGF